MKQESCPECRVGRLEVTDSRGGHTKAWSVRRRRKCTHCGVRLSTVELRLPLGTGTAHAVVKRSDVEAVIEKLRKLLK